jgi:hypothetical protein
MKRQKMSVRIPKDKESGMGISEEIASPQRNPE